MLNIRQKIYIEENVFCGFLVIVFQFQNLQETLNISFYRSNSPIVLIQMETL